MRSVACAVMALSAVAGTTLAQNTATMPAQTSQFSGSTRGYYFTAPVDFKITGINVLVATGSNNRLMNYSVVRFDNNTPPPLFSSTTNAFQKLAGGLDVPVGFHPVDINVRAGEVIGIYGNTIDAPGASSGLGSYGNATGGNFTDIFGNQVALFRSGMQFHLGSNNPANSTMHDVWAEGVTNTSNITRIEFMYDVIPAPGAAALLAMGGLVAMRRRR